MAWIIDYILLFYADLVSVYSSRSSDTYMYQWTSLVQTIGVKCHAIAWTHLKLSSAKWLPFYLGRNVLIKVAPGAYYTRLL